MLCYGIMQGRLTESRKRGIQFFPFENWEKEFYLAQTLGLDEIEFIFDYERYEENPLWTQKGIDKLKKVIQETGVEVRSVCFDYFMRRAFFKVSEDRRAEVLKENKKIINQVLIAMGEIGAQLLEIPLVDDSSMKTDWEKDIFAQFLLDIVNTSQNDLLFGLETDLPPDDFISYLDRFNHPRIGANYDSGNSSGLGYDAYEEVTSLRDKIFNIHIKDRVYQGTTVKLGTGSADFDKLFSGLKEIVYKKAFIMQAVRGEDGQEMDNISEQINFVKDYVKKYQLENNFV